MCDCCYLRVRGWCDRLWSARHCTDKWLPADSDKQRSICQQWYAWFQKREWSAYVAAEIYETFCFRWTWLQLSAGISKRQVTATEFFVVFQGIIITILPLVSWLHCIIKRLVKFLSTAHTNCNRFNTFWTRHRQCFSYIDCTWKFPHHLALTYIILQLTRSTRNTSLQTSWQCL